MRTVTGKCFTCSERRNLPVLQSSEQISEAVFGLKMFEDYRRLNQKSFIDFHLLSPLFLVLLFPSSNFLNVARILYKLMVVCYFVHSCLIGNFSILLVTENILNGFSCVNAGIDDLIGKMEVPGSYNAYQPDEDYSMTG